MLTVDQWQTIHSLTDWLDHDIVVDILKIGEEAGEAAAAYIGMTGQNPRKGVTHTVADVERELCDVMFAAAVALAKLTDDPAGVLDAKLRKVADRAAAETHPGFDIAGEPSTHQGPRARCWDAACERPVRLVEDVIS